ncbi:alanine acetyltransferase [Streptococcus equinus]|uniref:alanine acetyltransferase n=1 Tax=Streptococcus equinus TaxID=1335 RepID=UPI003C6FCE06
MNITYNENSVKWEYNGKNIEVTLNNILHAIFRKSKNMVVIEIGQNFIEEFLYYYSLNGKLLMKHNLETGEVTWDYNGKHHLTLPYTETVTFYPERDLILIIYRTAENQNAITALKIFDLNGNLLHSFTSPEGYTILYITDIEGHSAKIVCDATIEENVDPYGRDRFNFSLDLTTGILEKLGLAY